MKKLMLLLFFAAVAAGCKNSGKRLLPNISGKASEVVVVLDRSSWEGKLGDSFRESLGEDYPYLPQREPKFSIINVSHSKFTDLFKIHRNIIICDIKNDILKDTVQYLQNVWAYPQCVIRLASASEDGIQKLFSDNKNTIMNVISTAERSRMIENAKRYEEKKLGDMVREKFGGSPYFPVGYKLMKKTDDFIWIQDERQYSIQGILIYSYPADKTDNFDLDKIIAHRNEILKNNVPGMRENSWMTTGTYIKPSINFIKFNNRSFAEVRGFWEVQNDYMGGPFVSHSFYSRDGSKIIVVECFVYAPKFDKKQYLNQVLSIIYSFEWNSDKKN